MPLAETELIPGVRWGRHERFCTPAYWKVMCASCENPPIAEHFRLGRNLTEEIAACLLGGFGMSADLGLAAFERVRDLGLLEYSTSEHAIFDALKRPFQIKGRRVHYRYPAQKARYLSLSLSRLENSPAPEPFQSESLRAWLINLPGIGPKTASWIVRNHLASNDVAILDVHIIRAGRIMGLFRETDDVTRRYLEMERRFLEFSKALDCPASLLDSLMWDQMRVMPLRALSERRVA